MTPQRYEMYAACDQHAGCHPEVCEHEDDNGPWMRFSDYRPGLVIKPLEWKKHDNGWCWLPAIPTHCGYRIVEHANEIHGRWEFEVFGETTRCQTFEKCKQLAQQHWESEAGIGRYLTSILMHPIPPEAT